MDRRTFLLSGLSAAVVAGCRSGSGTSPTTVGTTSTTAVPPVTTGSTVAATTATSTSVAVPAVGGDGVLVLVTLYGGNDALNTVVPVGDPRYGELRGALAVDPAAALDLGDGFALHPALPGVEGLWDAGRLAVVHGVGFAGLDRSHFHCMDVWQAGDEHELGTGWIGRWLDAVGGDPLDAIAVGRQLPLALRGVRRSAAVVPVGPFALPDERLRRSLVELTAADAGRSPLAAMVASSTADLLDVVDTVGPLVVAAGTAVDGEVADEPIGGTAAPEYGGLQGELGVVAELIEGGLPTRVYGVALGGFDTHANQAGTHEALLGQLDTALAAFLARVGSRPVTVVVYSEFGRRVRPNGSGGTDHGGAGTVLVAGNVRPGHHGDAPPLDRLDDGDLTTTVDFRQLYAGLVGPILGTDPARLLPHLPGPPLDLVP